MVGIHFLLKLNYFSEWNLVDFVIMVANHHTLLIVHQSFYSCKAQLAGYYPIMGRWGASPLNMAQYRNAYIKIRKVMLNTFCNSKGSTWLISFCHDNDIAGLIPFKIFLQVFLQVTNLSVSLRNQDGFSSTGDSAAKGNETCIPAHHLNKEESVVASCCIPDFIHGFNHGVQCSIISNGIVGAINVIIDGSRDPHKGNIIILITKHSCSCQWPITSYDYYSINLSSFEILIGKLASFGFHKLLAPGSLQDGSAPCQYITHTVGFHLNKIIMNHPMITIADTGNFHSVIESRTGYAPDGCIHSRCISSGCKHSYSFNFSHVSRSLIDQN